MATKIRLIWKCLYHLLVILGSERTCESEAWAARCGDKLTLFMSDVRCLVRIRTRPFRIIPIRG